MANYTISVHCGSSLSMEHNRRDSSRTAQDGHIDHSRSNQNVILCDTADLRADYAEIFGDSIAAYNAKQRRSDRKITDYYTDIKNSSQKHLAYETIVQIGSRTAAPAEAAAALLRYADGWAQRNPQLVLVGAYLHMDEATPHLHMDWVPVAHCTRGMEWQNGLNAAMEQQMGSRSHSRSNTAQMAWQNRERECLLAICREMGLDMRDIQHNEKRCHLDTAAYKEKQADKTLQDARQRLSAAEDREKVAEAAEAAGKADLAAIRAQTEAARQDLADTLALKERAALIKKPGIFSQKSEVTYHANMIDEIQSIHVKVAQKLRAAETLLASVEAREAAMDRRERETTTLHEAAKADRAAAADERERVEDYILSTAKTWLKEALHGQPTDREKRLEQFCACIRLKDGINAIDVFNEQERQIEQQSHSWEQSR